MRFLIYAKGTKIKLTQPWEVHTHPGQWDVSLTRTFVLAKGTVLSIHDIDIRGNARYPKSMGFYICKGGCPMNPELEQSGFTVSLVEAANAEFELNGKVDAKLNGLDLALVQMEKEIKQNK